MNNVIQLDESKRRECVQPINPIVQALDALALALLDHGHEWTDRERLLYETAISYCGYTDSGSSA
ncbi:hypothetical protein [Herbaspirillum sp.]|uniref:hypothetical protein n=1 Tax=Herbaspirillum sp. TaxID=1890675 RepID=UPI002586ABF7|nr:hypothetical protein [Herbaspirillum sp.]MCP3947348.1 hypothetical protein [Herbaspirillum sp.]